MCASAHTNKLQSHGLELQLWRAPCGGSSGEGSGSGFIGQAMVDVSAVAWGLARVSGWYHICSLTGEVIGQLKVGTLICL